MEPHAIRVSEFAKMLSLPLSTAYDVIQTRRVETIRVGRAIRIPMAEVERFIRENTLPARGGK